MTVLHMDPTKLESVIQNIRALADECDAAKSRIYSEFEAEHDPTPIDDFPPAADKAIGNLNGRADTLEEAKNAIVAVNESGVGSMNAEGVISCDIPDSVSINNVDQLVSWSDAAIDVHDLQNIVETGRKSNGRDYDQVIESMREHADDFAYANAFIGIVGPENLTQLPLNLESMPSGSGYLVSDEYVQPLGPNEGNELAELEGMFLASASKGWDDEKCAAVAKAISGSVDEEDELGGITVLNAMLDGHDENGDHINDLEFNDAFLTSLANRLDDINWDWDVPPGGRYLAGQSIDPMAGVLDAMGNNPEAALDYLAPASTGGDFDMTRLEELSKRKWDEQGFAGFTAATAAASSLRSSNAPDVRDRANALTDNSIHLLAVNTDETMYDDDAKARIGLLLANCPGELTNAWNEGETLRDNMSDVKFSVATIEDANTLTYRVADSMDALTTIATQITSYAHSFGSSEAMDCDGDRESQVKVLNKRYRQGNAALGFLVGLADSKAGIANSDAAARKEDKSRYYDAVNGGVVTAVASVNVPFAVGYTVVATLIKPLVVGNNTAVASAAPEDVQEVLFAGVIQDASGLGIIDQDAYTDNNKDEEYTWIVHDPDGNCSIMLSNTNSGVNGFAQLKEWYNDIPGNSEIEDLVDDFSVYYDKGYESALDTANTLSEANKS
ncbi:DUF6571 family protein [Actinomyces ruminicola]|uniref:DUF6571 family protein n=1 Tax=Actinomyces ruminicola TaxID=332524 RepID=UPI0011CB6203|nr:DUF6571 family protein [Actinomyces ruminicola]